MNSARGSQSGKVYLVGAGPGDPRLITLRGVECLRQADIILYDYLANPLILEHAKDGTELVCLGKHGQSRIWSQSEINEKLVTDARAGKTVVRLKGGDPAIFARGAEEAQFLADQGIMTETIPGVTAALAAGSYAGIPVTHRDLASAVAFVTGQENAEKPDSNLDYDALARFPGTLVVYMGVTTARQWTHKLLQAGKSAETPAAIIRRCSYVDQKTIICRLGDLAEQLTPRRKIPPPVIIIIGDVVSLRQSLSWFEKRPLYGSRIMVTRPSHQQEEMVRRLTDLGADIVKQPAISIGPPQDWDWVDQQIGRLPVFDWVVFSSANGVRYFLNRIISLGKDTRALGSNQIAVIGPATAEALEHFHLRADLQPSEYRAEALYEDLADNIAGSRILLVRASRGREYLAEHIRSQGATVEQIVVYESRDVETPSRASLELMANGDIDWVTVTSSAIAGSLVRMFGEHLINTKLASISPVTSETLRQLGYEPAAEANDFTASGVIRCILESMH